jgi:GntR family transcriptional repressor for pyruvate dehydrogenase complex
MLRGLGVLDVGHGRRTKVKPIGAETLAHLLPLMLASGGQRTFDQIFEARLGVESQSAALAARRRTTAQLDRLRDLVAAFRREMNQSESQSLATDLEFHMEIARASDNPLFPMLLESLAGFVTYAQKESCANNQERRLRAVMSHEAIFEAIRDGDSDRARVEMESHLRYSMTRRNGDTAPVEQ